MSMSRSFGFGVGGAAIAALLAGCAAGGAAPAGGDALAALGTVSVGSPGAAQPWSSITQSGARVFASDSAAETVQIYSYKPLALLGTIGGLNEPQGLCNDKKTVWLANTGGSELIHYSAAGKMLGTLADPGQYVISCSVDALGDVAASNIISTSGGAGSVSIWTAGRGSPTNYPVAGLARVYFIGYDPHGNLFVDGSDDSGIFALAELAKGAPAFKPLTVSGATINFPGGVQYAYGALAIGDQSGPSGNAVIYQTQVSGSTAKVVGTTRLKNAGDVVEFCITRSKTVIAPGSYGLQIFTYPAGGGPIRSISAGPGQELAGCAIVY
jgi:hypothetical protein